MPVLSMLISDEWLLLALGSIPKTAKYQQKNVLKLQILGRQEQVSLVIIGHGPFGMPIPQDGGA